TVSKIARELYEKVEEFLNKPVEKEIPYLFVDASYYKVRDMKQRADTRQKHF
ncbi:MAG: transposase, partial [Thermotogae bacterium]|nr:transposase [Thermotogota bacterium]